MPIKKKFISLKYKNLYNKEYIIIKYTILYIYKENNIIKWR